ncbi:MAG: cell division protein FtsW [Rhizobiales bacterium NRL2]|jgi:cell division protein FtsW|nr:MAG: cell division protein FtsW [Rhizobiales bacterium NRL2]
MIGFGRTDRSTLGRWWWTVDKFTLVAFVLLIGIGITLTLAAGPATAHRKGLDHFFFVQRQMIFLAPALAALVGLSILSVAQVRRLAIIGFALAFLATLATLFMGVDVNGATRWLRLGGLSVQPSEFIKPTFVVVTAWLIAAGRREPGGPPGVGISALLCLLIVGVLAMQPDIGMSLVVACVWAAQYFVAGMPMLLVGVLAAAGAGALFGAYHLFEHVRERFDRFLDPSAENYQVERALEAFEAGGLTGRGPGQGEVKYLLPDGHTDFVFAVAAEEFGALACVVGIALFALIVVRGLMRMRREDDLFVVLCCTGFLAMFGLQAAVNIGVNLNLLPTKGMTLPFISYGGSSLVALSIGAGFLLALMRRQAPGGGG